MKTVKEGEEQVVEMTSRLKKGKSKMTKKVDKQLNLCFESSEDDGDSEPEFNSGKKQHKKRKVKVLSDDDEDFKPPKKSIRSTSEKPAVKVARVEKKVVSKKNLKPVIPADFESAPVKPKALPSKDSRKSKPQNGKHEMVDSPHKPPTSLIEPRKLKMETPNPEKSKMSKKVEKQQNLNHESSEHDWDSKPKLTSGKKEDKKRKVRVLSDEDDDEDFKPAQKKSGRSATEKPAVKVAKVEKKVDSKKKDLEPVIQAYFFEKLVTKTPVKREARNGPKKEAEQKASSSRSNSSSGKKESKKTSEKSEAVSTSRESKKSPAKSRASSKNSKKSPTFPSEKPTAKVAKVGKPVDNKKKALKPSAKAKASSSKNSEKLRLNPKLCADGKYQCPFPNCPTKVTRKDNILTHYRAKHLGKKFQCDECEQGFDYEFHLTQHVDEVHRKIKHPCPICGQEFTKKSNRDRHIEVKHPENPEAERVQFECVYENCGEKFLHKETLQRHVNTDHIGIRFKCEQCESVFTRNDDLVLHVKIQHENFRLKCSKCPMKFKSKSGHRHHKLTVHYNGKIFRCHCSRVFTSKESLDMHKTKHQNDAPERCYQCDKTFLSKRELTIHKLWKHDGYTSHGRTCEECEAEVANHPSLLFHMHFAHKGQDMNLNLDHTCVYSEKEEDEFVRIRMEKDGLRCCKTQFKTEKALRIHVALCHKPICWWPNLVRHKLTNIGRTKEEVTTRFQKLYDLAKLYLKDSDRHRKLYLLVFVPNKVTEENLLAYLAKPSNKFFFYWGKKTLDGGFEFVSPHHTRGFCKLSTHYLTKLRNMKAFHIADIPLGSDCEEGKGAETIAFMEAKEILRIVLFSKLYKKTRAFQKLELNPFSNVTLEQIQEIYEDVVKSGGDWNKLENTRVDFIRWIKIPTGHVTANDTAPFKCSHCKFQAVSNMDLCFHKFEKHRKDMDATTRTEKILSLYSPQPSHIYNVLQEAPANHSFNVYVVLNVKKELKWNLEMYNRMEKQNLESYVGKNSKGVTLSAYHFQQGKPSTIKNMKEVGSQLIHFVNYKCESLNHAEKVELTQILIGIIRREAHVNGGPCMQNRFWNLKFMPYHFQRKDMEKLVDFCFTEKDQFLDNQFVPDPIRIGTLIDIPCDDAIEKKDTDDADKKFDFEQFDYEELVNDDYDDGYDDEDDDDDDETFELV